MRTTFERCGLGFAGPSGVLPSFTLSLITLFIGYMVGRRRSFMRARHNMRACRNEFADDGRLRPDTTAVPSWFNYGLIKLWRLFQKNSKQLTQESLQPILDEVDKPNFVKAVRLVRYAVGDHAPVIRELQPVPARSLADIQCTFRMLYSSTSDLEFEVDVVSPMLPFNKTFTIPVALKNLQVDTFVWSAFTMAPYEPYCTRWRYSLLEKPNVKFDMKVGRALPITDVPFLRSFFFDLIRQEIPRDFIFPASNTVDFTPKKLRAKKEEFMDMKIEEIEELSEDDIQAVFPEQWHLYNSLNLNKDCNLTLEEFTQELEGWGYSTKETSEYFDKMDLAHKGSISFPQFCMMWPNVTASEVPEEYEGVLYVYLHSAEGLKTPMLGDIDPVVKLRVGNETATTSSYTDRSRQSDLARPTWNESFELLCMSPENQTLEVLIEDRAGGIFQMHSNIIGRAEVSLKSLLEQPSQTLNLDLLPKGNMTVDISNVKFVDQWNTAAPPMFEENDGNFVDHISADISP